MGRVFFFFGGIFGGIVDNVLWVSSARFFAHKKERKKENENENDMCVTIALHPTGRKCQQICQHL